MRRNLEEVERVLETVEERRKGVREVLALPGATALQAVLSQVDDRVGKAREAVRTGNPRETQDCLDQILAAATEIRRLLRVGETTAAAVEERWLPLGSGELHDTLSDLLVAKAHDQIEVLDAIRDAAHAAVRTADEQVARKMSAEAWRRYSVEAHDSTQEVFREYVDLLGGLALRESGFDHGICTIADQLVRKSGTTGFRWSSMTIPVREEALNVTLAWIVRLGFPEWTLWALPLAAHELGHVIVRQTGDMQDYIKKHAGGDPQEERDLQVLLADAFATYVMGPAYACCSILIRLDPLTAYSGPANARIPGLTARRAAVLLGMLEYVNGKSHEKPWNGVVELLREAWETALVQAGHTAPPPPLQDEAVKRLVQFMVKKTGLGRGMPTGKWSRVAGWAEKLRDGTSEAIGPKYDDELRYVLNAAWVARLKSPGALELDTIADRALELWRHIEGVQAGAATGPGWVVRRDPPRSGEEEAGEHGGRAA